jgi:hypothetical protein
LTEPNRIEYRERGDGWVFRWLLSRALGS